MVERDPEKIRAVLGSTLFRLRRIMALFTGSDPDPNTALDQNTVDSLLGLGLSLRNVFVLAQDADEGSEPIEFKS